MHTRHLALTHLLLLSLLLGCSSKPSPPPTLSTQHEDEAEEELPQEKSLSTIFMPTPSQREWTVAEHVSIISLEASPYGEQIDILFDRPIQKDSVHIDFESELTSTWVSPQLLRLSSKEALPEGEHTLTISSTLMGEDGTQPPQKIEESFSTMAPPKPRPVATPPSPKKARREARRARPSSRPPRYPPTQYMAYAGSIPRKKNRDYIASTSPKLLIGSTIKLTQEEIEESVQLVHRDDWAEPKIIPSRISYLGKRKTDLEYNDFPLKHHYRLQPLKPLEEGKKYHLLVKRRRHHDHREAEAFTPLASTFTASVEAYSTNVVLSTTHPISRKMLKDCVEISPKPRVHQIQPYGGNRQHEIDILPAMPGMTYTLKLDSCTSSLGTKLSGKRRLEVTLGDYFDGYAPEYLTKSSLPAIWNPLESDSPKILESEEFAKAPILPLLSRHISTFQVKAQRITESTLAHLLIGAGQEEAPLEEVDYLTKDITVALRKVERRDIDLTEVLNEAFQGIIRLPKQAKPVVFVSTDLGVTAQHDTIWVTRHSDSTPVLGATVRIWEANKHEPVEELTTDADGVARSVTLATPPPKGRSSPPTLITVSYNGDTSYLSPYPYRERREPHRNLKHHVTTDRGLYRPGEVVHLAGWVREWSGQDLVIPHDGTVQVELRSPSKESTFCEQKLTKLGGWHCEVTLPEHAAQGEYTLHVALAPRETRHTSPIKIIRVERISPPRFMVHLRHLPGDDVLEGDVQRLAGPFMPDTPIEYAIHTRPTTWTTPEHPRFVFGRQGEGEEIASGTTVSDAQGSFRIDLSKLPKVTEPHERWIEISAVDADGVTLRNSLKWSKLPDEVHGVRYSTPKRQHVHRAIQEMHVDVVTIRPEHPEKTFTSRRVRVEFVRKQRHWEWRQGPGGEHEHVVVSDKEDILDRCKMRRQNGYASCIYRPGKDGSWIRVRVGKQIVQERRFYVASAFAGAADLDKLQVISQQAYYRAGEVAKLLLEVPYFAGETTALLLMEGKHFPTHGQESTTGKKSLWTKAIPIRSGSQILDIPLDRDLKPQHVNLTVHVIQGRLDKRRRSLMTYASPSHTIWFTNRSRIHELVWNRSIDQGRPVARTLHTGFEILPPKEENLPTLSLDALEPSYLPGQEVSMNIKLTGDGAAAEALVVVVDEGALNMTGHDIHRPRFRSDSELYHGKPSPSRDSRDHLTTPTEVGMKSNPGGGGSVPSGATLDPRREEEVTAHAELVTLDPRTHSATVRFQAPDRISNYRVMVLATQGAEGHDFVKSTASFEVVRPFHVRPAFPPFFSHDDLVTLRALVMASEPGDYEVRAEFDDHLLLEGSAATQTVTIRHAGEAVPISWSVRVDGAATKEPTEQETRIVLHGRSSTAPDISDSVEITRPVRRGLDNTLLSQWRDRKARDRIWRGSTRGLIREEGIRIPIDLQGFVLDEDATLEVTIHSSSSQYINTLIQSLNTYPHGCAEQTSTKLHGLLAIHERGRLKNRKPHSNLTLDEVKRRIKAGVKRLESMIHSNGDVSLWPTASPQDPFLTAYVAWVYVRARAILPDAVSQPHLDRLLDALTRHVQRGAADPFTLAMSHYVLAVAERAQPNHLATLYEQRAELSRDTNAWLAMAYHAMHLTAQRDELLAAALDSTLRLSATRHVYHSELRARSIIALAVATSSSNLVVEAMKFMQNLPSTHRLTTQERGFLLMAMNALEKEQKTPPGNHLEIAHHENDRLIDTTKLSEDTDYVREFSLFELEQRGVQELSFELNAPAEVRHATYQIKVKGRRAHQPARAWKELQSARVYVHAQGTLAGQPITSPLKVGDVIAVHHYISCQDNLRDLAILDPLPPGIERIHDASNVSLSEQRMLDTTSKHASSLPGPFSSKGLAPGRFFQETLATAQGIYPTSCGELIRPSYLARAMTPGTYHIWPSYLERMYRPEYNAFTHDDGETITIIE